MSNETLIELLKLVIPVVLSLAGVWTISWRQLALTQQRLEHIEAMFKSYQMTEADQLKRLEQLIEYQIMVMDKRVSVLEEFRQNYYESWVQHSFSGRK